MPTPQEAEAARWRALLDDDDRQVITAVRLHDPRMMHRLVMIVNGGARPLRMASALEDRQ